MFESLSRNQEVIIIRKLLSLFLVLVVITSLSVTAFATGEQPSGSSYQYYIGNTSTSYDTFWVAISKGLVYIGQQTKLMNGYLSTANNYYSYIRSDLADIKLAIDPTSSSSNFQTPYGSSYSYYTTTDTTSSTNFWNAVNNQLQYLSRHINSIDTKLDTIGPQGSNYPLVGGSGTYSYTDFWTAASTSIANSAYDTDLIRQYSLTTRNNTTSIASSNSNIDNTTSTLLTDVSSTYYPYMSANGRISQADSSNNFWNAVSWSLSYLGADIEIMRQHNVNYFIPYLQDLHTMFASPEDLALKADQENNISAATSNFLSGSDSSTSVGTQSIGKVKDLGDDVSSFFDTGVQATSLFDSLSDTSSDGPWLWFTSAVRDNLTGTQSRSNTKSSSLPGEQVVDYYSNKMAALDKLLGEVSEDD